VGNRVMRAIEEILSDRDIADLDPSRRHTVRPRDYRFLL
jgi:hypothetical protein